VRRRRPGCGGAELSAQPCVTRAKAEPSPGRILLVDDDPDALGVLSAFLTRHDYQVEIAGDVSDMEAMLDRFTFDAIVLDVMLPGEGGLSICRRLARPGGPAIIMLSALCDETDRIVGLEVGADDYLPKPCNPRELLARLRAVLRRRGEPSVAAASPGGVCQFVGWRLDMIRRELRSPRGVTTSLSGGEFALLRVFIERPLQVLTRDRLLDLAHGADSQVVERSIEVQVHRLRRKLDDGWSGRELILNLRKEGYVFTAHAHGVRPSQGFAAPLPRVETHGLQHRNEPATP
jgi:two-component system OmpR family response regulator